jgi:hypothetical protein
VGPFKFVGVFISSRYVKILGNRIVTGFHSISNMQEIWNRLQVAMRRQAEAYIQAGGGHMEHLL